MFKRFLLLVLALIGLPLVWVLGKCFLETLFLDMVTGQCFTVGRVAFGVGCLLMVLLYLWKGRSLMVLYVFAHEMTHAVAGLCCFAKIHKISIGKSGGYVQLSKSNLVITLAPYCVPFYLLCGILLYILQQIFVPDVLPFAVWATLFGFLTAFHVLFTADALLTVSQPDTHEYGRCFSWWLIVVTNLFFALMVSTAISPKITMLQQMHRLVLEAQRVYTTVYTTSRQTLMRLTSSTTSHGKGASK